MPGPDPTPQPWGGRQFWYDPRTVTLLVIVLALVAVVVYLSR
jgi:hypothetical protein